MPFLRKYVSATGLVYVPIRKAGSRDFATSSDWTPAAGDVKVSNGAINVSNIFYLPTYANGAWAFDLNGSTYWPSGAVQVIVIDSATKAVEDTCFLVESFGHSSANHKVDYTDGVAFGITRLASIYHADIKFVRDQANTQDEYTVAWYKDGLRVTSGITSPVLRITNRSAGTELRAGGMTQIASTGLYKWDEGTYRATLGESLVVVAEATIDGATRQDSRLITRDSVQSV